MANQAQAPPFGGNDAILQGLIFAMIFQQPSTKLYIFPIPMAIPAYVGAGVILLGDYFFNNMAGLGGVGAAYLMTTVIWTY